jgi:hypothetical protein
VLREPGRTEVEALGSDLEEQAPELDDLPVLEHDRGKGEPE